jgi:hypothetical protein
MKKYKLWKVNIWNEEAKENYQFEVCADERTINLFKNLKKNIYFKISQVILHDLKTDCSPLHRRQNRASLGEYEFDKKYSVFIDLI